MAKPALAAEALVALRRAVKTIEERTGDGSAAAPIRPAAAGWETADDHGTPFAVDGGPLDAALGGGWPAAGLNEIRAAGTADHGAASAFALALARQIQAARARHLGRVPRILFVSDPFARRETGQLDATGLSAFGIAPETVLHASPRKLDEALSIAELALAVEGIALTILEVAGNPARFGLTESRRLHLKARGSGRPLVVLRVRGEEEASSARLRLALTTLPAAPVRLADGSLFSGAFGAPRFNARLEKGPLPEPANFALEWNPDDQHLRPAALDEPRPARHPGLPSGPPHPGAHPALPVDGPDRAQALGHLLAFPRSA